MPNLAREVIREPLGMGYHITIEGIRRGSSPFTFPYASYDSYEVWEALALPDSSTSTSWDEHESVGDWRRGLYELTRRGYQLKVPRFLHRVVRQGRPGVDLPVERKASACKREQLLWPNFAFDSSVGPDSLAAVEGRSARVSLRQGAG